LPQTPSPALLKAEEATERLREIVEQFFYRGLKAEDGTRIRSLLIKSPPGLGKTKQAIEWAIRYLKRKDGRPWVLGDVNEAGVWGQTAIFVPRHQLADELRDTIEHAYADAGEPIRVPILRGRENGGEEGTAPCRRWREARELARKGLPIYVNLCQRRTDGQLAQCPYFAGCEYIETRRAAYSSPFIILVHSHLGLEWGATAAERFDDAVEGAENEGEDGPEPERLFNPRQANTILCDEDPTGSLVEETRLSADDIRGLGTDGLGDKILAGLSQPGGLLTYLRSEGVSPERLREAAEEARRAERSRGQISSPEVDLQCPPTICRTGFGCASIVASTRRLCGEFCRRCEGPDHRPAAGNEGVSRLSGDRCVCRHLAADLCRCAAHRSRPRAGQAQHDRE
jgi:hypothetical protein